MANNMATSTFGGGGKGSAGTSPVAPRGHDPLVTWGGGELVNNRIDGGAGGVSWWSTLAIATAQAVLAEEQFTIAQDYFNSNFKDFKFNMNYYLGFDMNSNGSFAGPFGPQPGPMLAFKERAFATPFYVADYYPMTGASVARVKAYDEKWLQSRRRAHRYALGAQRHMDYNYYMLRRKAAFMGWTMGRRVEDSRKDMLDGQIQTHRVQALNFGITAGNIAKQGLGASVASRERMFDELGSQLGGLSNGLAQLTGYKAGRQLGDSQLRTDSGSHDGSGMASHTVGTGPA